MTRTEKILAVIILVQAIAMPFLTRYYFRDGFRTAAQLGVRMVPRPPPVPKTGVQL